jgi:hypothetical protein
MTLAVQTFLQEQSPNALFAQHGVKVIPTRDDRGNVILSLNYDQLASKTTDPVSRECRGTVLRPIAPTTTYDPTAHVGETRILARPMRRFMNLGEGLPEDQVDLTDPDALFETKEDGTLSFVYFDPEDNRWHVGTRNMARGHGRSGSLTNMSFRELFENTTGQPMDVFANRFNGLYTYSFELTTPFNEVGVAQETARVTLLAVRNNQSGIELDSHMMAATLGLTSPTTHRHESVAAMLAWVHEQPAKAFEGLVAKVYDKSSQTFRRVKIKSRNYVAAAHSKGDTVQSPRSILTLILGNQWDDVGPTLNPMVRAVGDSIQDKVQALCSTYDRLYTQHVELLPPTADRKTVATAIHTNGIPIPFGFAKRDNPSLTYSDFLRSLSQPSPTNPTGWKDSVLNSVLKSIGM